VSKKIVFTYYGKQFRNEKLVSIFQDAKGEEYVFGKVRVHQIGGKYEGIKSKEGVQIHTRPDYLGPSGMSENEISQLQMKSAAAEESYQEHLKERKVVRVYEFQSLVDAFHARCAGLNDEEVRMLAKKLAREVIQKRLEKLNREMSERLKRAFKKAKGETRK